MPVKENGIRLKFDGRHIYPTLADGTEIPFVVETVITSKVGCLAKAQITVIVNPEGLEEYQKQINQKGVVLKYKIEEEGKEMFVNEKREINGFDNE